METKRSILLFNRKEIFILLALFVLVALFSFTLGLRLGKTLAMNPSLPENAPFKALQKDEVVQHEPAKDEHGGGDAQESAEHAAEQTVEHHDPGQKAEDLADLEMVNEIQSKKVGLEKPVPMNLPKDRKNAPHSATAEAPRQGKRPEYKQRIADAKGAGHFTLQVGSHKTREEASSQISALKETGVEAAVVEAKVPGKGVWYRVHVGSFESKEVAETTGVQWRSTKNLPAYIVQKVTERQ